MTPTLALRTQDGILITAYSFPALFARKFRNRKFPCRPRVAVNIPAKRQSSYLIATRAINRVEFYYTIISMSSVAPE